jgi:hypothetical protein
VVLDVSPAFADFLFESLPNGAADAPEYLQRRITRWIEEVNRREPPK